MSVSVQFSVDPLSPVNGPSARLSFSGPHPNHDQSVPAADFTSAKSPDLCREESRNGAFNAIENAAESKTDESLPAVRPASSDGLEKKRSAQEKDTPIPVISASPSPVPIAAHTGLVSEAPARPAASASLFSHMYKIDNIVPDFLWISGVGASKERQVLQQLQITHIINCTNECANRFPTTFEYRRIEVSDDISQGDAIYAAFEEVSGLLDRLQKDGKRVLVHCAAGQSRSATIALAYLVKHQGMSLRHAYRYLKDRRPVTRPNTAFFESLLRWEKELRGDNSCTIDEYKARRL